jgi:two-component system, cell cycle sensor histidine kinase and response regulator CckA
VNAAEPLHVLILEDSEDHAELMQRALRKGGIDAACRVVGTESTFRDALIDFAPQLVLADLLLPAFSGTKAVTIVHEWDATVPCILVSGVAGEELAVSALRSGASDYVLKGRLESLPAAVRRALDEAAEKRLLEDLDAERRRAEVALRESEAKYRRMVDTASEGILALGADGMTVTFVNPRLAEMVGRAVGDILGGAVTDVMFEEDVADHRARLEGRRRGASEQYERRFRRADGRAIWTIVSATPVFDEEQHYLGSFAMLTDITERKRTEQSLVRVNFALNNVHEAAYLIDEAAQFQFVNEEACRMLGYTRAELLTMGVPDIDPELASELWPDLWRELVSRRSMLFEGRHRTKDGRFLPVEVSVTCFEFESQALNLALVRDISERKQAEAALNRLNRELRAVSTCNQALVRATDEKLLLAEICRIICEEAGYRMAWVGYAEHDDAATVRPVAWGGFDDGYLGAASISWADTERGQGATGTAIRTGTPGHVRDFATDALAGPWRQAALERGYRSSIALPLRDDSGAPFGALNIYSTESNAFTPDETRLLEELANDLAFGICVLRGRDALRRADDERREHVALLESLDRVNRAIQGSGDLDQMMSDVLDAALSIFDCDRAFLLFPCDPDAATWHVPMEVTRPEFPGALELGVEVPMSSHVAETVRTLAMADGPVAFGPGSPHALPADAAARFGFRSLLSMALRPKVDKIWQFGIHQCSYDREWTAQEHRLFAEIGHRLEDGLTVLLARRQLVDSEQRYRQVFEDSPISLWEEDFHKVKERFDSLRAEGVADLDAYFDDHPEAVGQCVALVDIVDLNKATLTLHGATSKEELVSGMAALFTPEALDAFRHELVNLWNGLVSATEETVTRRLGGEIRNVTVQYSVAPGYEQTLGRIIVSISDVTERRRADEEIRALNRELELQVQQYRMLLDQASDAIFVSDADRHYTDANVAACELLGYSREELLGLSISDITPPDENPGQPDRFARMGAGDTVLSERLLRRKDGSLLVSELNSRRLPDGRYQAIVRDITARKRLEQEQARLAAAVEQADEAIVITDPSATILYVNPSFERVTGYGRAELIGANPRILQSGHHDAAFYGDMWSTLRAGHTWRGTFMNCRKDGSLFEEDAAITPIRDGTGAVVSYVGVKRDVTREKALEAQLRQSQKMEAVGQLAGGIAHDFNNLITAIRGYSEFVRESLPSDATQRVDIDQVVLAADRAAELTRQLLAFSRRQVLQPQVVAPAEIVERIAPMLRRLLGEHIELLTHAAPDPGYVRVDPSQLEQIIVNLAVNARDALPEGGRLILETDVAELIAGPESEGRDLAPGRYVLLRVTDTGVGMDEDTRARAFEPFFTTKAPGLGTGMGLATVYGIVSQSGGEIRLRSEVGQGTTFTVWLPRVAVDTAEAAAAAAPGAAPRGSGTILLVEDDPGVRTLARRALKELGYTLIEASDGVEAMASMAEHRGRLDLLLTDLIMPRMGGQELAEHLRTTRPKLPVLFMSGFADRVTEVDEITGHGSSLINKPFTRESLGRAVRDALKANR